MFALALAVLSAGSHGCKQRERVEPDAASVPAARPNVALTALRAARVPALARAIVREGHVERCEALGDAQLSPSRAATPDTIFHAASLGKPIVGVAVMKLVEDGLIGLDDDVAKSLPFPVSHPARGAAPITLRRLLTHTASLHDRFDLLARASAPGEAPIGLSPFLGSYLAKMTPESFLREPPGTTKEYSNVGVALAALVVESLRKEPFDIVARRTIFEPLRMNAAFRTSAFDAANVATPHVSVADRFEPRPLLGRAVYPACDLRASASALGRFVLAMLRGGELEGARVLSKASVDTMLASELGWQLVRLEGRALVGHEGEDDGASAAMFIDRERAAGAVVLANGDAFTSGDASRVNAINALVASSLRGE